MPHSLLGVIHFDGYPQSVKQEESQPVYKIKKEKDIIVVMRDGVRPMVDVYRPDVEGMKFTAILAWGDGVKMLRKRLNGPTINHSHMMIVPFRTELGKPGISCILFRGDIYTSFPSQEGLISLLPRFRLQ